MFLQRNSDKVAEDAFWEAGENAYCTCIVNVNKYYLKAVIF